MDQSGCPIENATEITGSLAEFLADPDQHKPKPEFVNGSHLIDDRNTVLTHCVKHGNVAAVNALLSAGADANLPNSARIKLISTAAHIGNTEIMRLLFASGAVFNTGNSIDHGSTPIIQAAHFGHLEAVRLLLHHKAAADCVNRKGTTALMRAAQEGYTDIVTCLIEAGVDVNRKNQEGMTALLLASQRGHREVVSILVRAGAKIDMQTARGTTALMLACKRGHEACAKVLISWGADVDIQDHTTRTAQDLAAQRHHHGILFDRIEHPTEIIPGFLYMGNYYNEDDEKKLTDLHVTHIVDATSNFFFRDNAKALNVSYLPVPVYDLEGLDIRQHLQIVFDFIAQAKGAENSRVLIHCNTGISRSPTFVLAYLMHSGLCSTLKAAVELVMRAHPNVMPHASFRAQLMDYEESLFGTRSLADDDAFLACMAVVNYCQSDQQVAVQVPSGMAVSHSTATPDAAVTTTATATATTTTTTTAAVQESGDVESPMEVASAAVAAVVL